MPKLKKGEYFSLPKLKTIEKSGKPTADFGKFYKTMLSLIAKQYPNDASWQWGKPRGPQKMRDPITTLPSDPAEFVAKRFARSPDFEQSYSTVMFTYFRDLESRQWKLQNGLTLRPDQIADISYTLFSLATGKRSQAAHVLLRKPPNGGKTVELGVFNTGFALWQDYQVAAGDDPMVGAFSTSKPIHQGQQSMGAKQRILSSPPFTLDEKTANGYHKQLKFLYGDIIDRFFPNKGKTSPWKELLLVDHGDLHGMQVVCDSLRHRDLWQQFQDIEKSDDILQTIASLIDGEFRIANGIYKTPDFLRPPPRPKGGERSLDAYGGDSLPEFPAQYPIVAGQKQYQLHELNGHDPRFMLATTGNFTGSRARLRVANLLKRTVFVTLDEAKGLNPLQITNAVRESGAGREPIVIAATAMDRNRPQWIRTPAHSVHEGVEKGYLPNWGFRLIGSGEYSKGTEEAWEEFCDAYFADSRLLKQNRQTQPYKRNTLIAVPPKLTRECAHRLAKAFGERGLTGKVACYDGKTGVDKDAYELWFVNQEDEPKNLPHVLITSVSQMAHAVHLPNLELAVLLDETTDENAVQFFGRPLHSTQHLSLPTAKRNAHGVLCWQQHFAGMNPRKMYLRILDEQGKLSSEGQTWVDDHRVHSQKAFAFDSSKTKKGYKPQTRAVPDLPDPKKKRRNGKPERQGTNMELTAPILQNAKEAELFNMPAHQITAIKLLGWAQTYNAAVMGTYSAGMKKRAYEYIEDAKKQDQLGRFILQRMRVAIDQLASRPKRLSNGNN